MEVKTFLILLLATVFVVVCRRNEEESQLYELTAQDLKTKEEIPMSRYRGKVNCVYIFIITH